MPALTLHHQKTPAQTSIPFSCCFTNFITVIFFFLDEPALLTKSAFFLENKSWNGIRYNYTEKENTTDCGLLCLRVRQFKLIKLQQAEMGKANVVKE